MRRRYVRVRVRLSRAEEAALRKSAASYGMTLDEVARAALGDWLADHEGVASWACDSDELDDGCREQRLQVLNAGQ
jgi:hypothetical protein